MLDYNHRPTVADRVNAAIDDGLVAERGATPARDYLGGSRLGHPCERALPFEFVGAPKDAGAGFDGKSLRIFAIGHALEDLAVCWLRGAGFDLCTRKGNSPDGAGSSALPSPVGACAAMSMASWPEVRHFLASGIPPSGNARL